MVNFTPRPLNPVGKGPRYSFDMRFGGPQNPYGWRVEDKIVDFTGT
jgi:hypothetical protein